jgi:SAM-dependent methyltransferase
MFEHRRNPSESTPEHWATLANLAPVEPRRAAVMRRSAEWVLITRFVQRGHRILDAGCGNGAWTALADRRGSAAGCDYSPEIVARLRVIYPEIEWRQADIRHMPYGDGEFDAVMSWGVIEHDHDGPSAALREIHRVLKPGGVAIVTVPRDTPQMRRAAERTSGSGDRTFYEWCMSSEELAAELAAAGFDVVEQGVIPAANLYLVAPWTYGRIRGFPLRVAQSLTHRTLSLVTARYAPMQYAVARTT